MVPTINGRLADLPQLAAWYETMQENPPAASHQPVEHFAWRFCHALTCDEATSVALFIPAMRSFLATTPAPLTDFLAAVSLFADFRVDLLAEFALLGEQAIDADHCDPFGAVMSAAADVTGLVALRFLAAWAALHSRRLSDCVEECEKVDQPYAHVYALQGQALLEQGLAHEAVAMLQGAVKLGPGEVTAWFQLAKAQHVLGDTEKAWAALASCARLAPHNGEVAMMMGLVALGHDASLDVQAEASRALAQASSQHGGSFDLLCCRLRLAARLDRPDEALAIIASSEASFDMRDRRSLGMLATILREWNAKGWLEPSERLLAVTLAAAPQAS